MKCDRDRQKVTEREPATPLRTTIMELLCALSDLMEDNRQVLSTFESIFASHRARLARSSVPIQLVSRRTAGPVRGERILGTRISAWV